MTVWKLGEYGISSLLELPETGMGFQLVQAIVWGNTKPLLVFNSERAIDLSDIGLMPGDDPSVILRNGFRIVDAMKDQFVKTITAAPQPHSFQLFSSRITTGQTSAGSVLHAAMPSSLVKHVLLTRSRTFHRFSAFSPDRRVDPVTGSFLAGTYAAPESELPLVPTGFTAVARFALPNNLPASHHYEIEAPTATGVDFGTVGPAFGQPGGGVEAYFQNLVLNAKVPPISPSKLPDE